MEEDSSFEENENSGQRSLLPLKVQDSFYDN